jgi:catabolite regulation protein CreA
MRSLCWTDHANVTRQVKALEVDAKRCRWVSEIVADGSEISFTCRQVGVSWAMASARNPKDRDEILAQRMKDLEGLMGQVRGFDL